MTIPQNSVWLLMAAIAVVGSNSLVLSPIATEVAASFAGRGAADVLGAAAAYGAGTTLSALVLAPQADRIGLRRALVWALLSLTAAFALSAFAPTLPVLIAAQTGAGLAAGLALPAIYGLAADIAPKGRESATLGKVLTGWTVSLVAGVALAAILADAVNWRAVFASLSAAGAILAALLARAHIGPAPTGVVGTSPLAALRIAGVIPLLLSVGCYMAAFYGLYAYLGPHLTGALALSTTAAGIAALSYGIGFGAAAPLDRLIDRYGAARAAPVVFAGLLAVYLGLAAVSQIWPLVLAACVIWGTANHLGLNILVGQLTALSPAQRGTILGLYSAVTYAAMSVGTALFKPAFEAFGFAPVALMSAACIAPALVGALGRRAARAL
ncbi:MAG: MFS transporter [Pseudomonadota bacterium]